MVAGRAGSESVSLASAQLRRGAGKQVVLAASSSDDSPGRSSPVCSWRPRPSGGLRLVATDSFRLAMRDVAGVSVLDEGQSVLIPSRALSRAQPDPRPGRIESELAPGEREAGVRRVGDVRLVTRLIEGDFPNYRGLIPESSSQPAHASTGHELLDALRRVRLLARESTPIRLVISRSGMGWSWWPSPRTSATARESVEASYEG